MARKVSFGDGGHRDLTRAIRAHGNSIEHSLIFISVPYFAETHAYVGPRLALALGSAFVFARILYCAALFMRFLSVGQLAYAVTQLLQITTTTFILTH